MNVLIVYNGIYSGRFKNSRRVSPIVDLLRRQYFRQWRDNIQEEKDDRQLTQYAIDHYNRTIKRKILLAWNNQMIQQILIENENEMKLNKYKQEKNHYSLQIIYHQWKQRTNEQLRNRFLHQRSQRFYEQNLLRKIFSQWKEHHHFDMRIKVKLIIKKYSIALLLFSYSNDKLFGLIECVP